MRFARLSRFGNSLLALLILGGGCFLHASEHPIASVSIVTEAEQMTMSPAVAYERLCEGNERFVSGHRVERDWPEQVHETAHGQHPFATIVSCMDSRTAVEQIFDLG